MGVLWIGYELFERRAGVWSHRQMKVTATPAVVTAVGHGVASVPVEAVDQAAWATAERALDHL
jgi:hypothetical protein